MQKKLPNITNKLYPSVFLLLIIIIWHVITETGMVPGFMLPSPRQVVTTFMSEFPTLLDHMGITLLEAALGLILSILFAFIIAIMMDEWDFLYKAIDPVLVITQTIPTIAVAPLLILWLGYGILPKVMLVFITCFFPLTVSILTGLKSADQDILRLFRSMNASKLHILWNVKLPFALENFFSGLKVSVTYAVVGAVISEWLGGTKGLGVYMTRVRKAYAFDKMFAVIFLISMISITLMMVVNKLEKKAMPWKDIKYKE